MSDNKINLIRLGRKRIPTGTLISSQDGKILSFGLPSKRRLEGSNENLVLQYTLDENDRANLVSATAIPANDFITQYNNVYRTTKSITLPDNKHITTSRIGSNVDVVKESKKRLAEEGEEGEGPEKKKQKEPDDDVKRPAEEEGVEGEEQPEKKVAKLVPEEEEEEEETEKEEDPAQVIQKVGLDVHDAAVDNGPGVISEEEKEEKVAEEGDELISVAAHAMHASEPPVESQPPPTPSSKSPVDYHTEFLRSLEDEFTKADPKDKQEHLDRLIVQYEVVEKLKRPAPAEPNEHPVDVQDREEEEVEKEAILENTKNAQEALKEADESAEARLSGHKAVNAPVTSADTGGANDMDIEHQLDNQTTDQSKPDVIAAKDRIDIPVPMDVDKHNSDDNQHNQVTLGADAESNQLDKPEAHTNSISTSANAMNAVHSLMEVDPEDPNAKKARQALEKEEEKESRMTDISKSQQQAESRVQEQQFKEHQAEMAEQAKSAAAESDLRMQLSDAKGDIPGINYLNRV